jgi:hypothetical protein
MRTALRFIALLVLVVPAARPSSASAQDRRDEQYYYPGSFNWQFLNTYPEAARLFNAFDYGHAVLYEKLYTEPGKARADLAKEYRFLTTDLLVRPPRFAVAEEAVAPSYFKLAWRAKQMFDWAHVLHRQIYDAYADENMLTARKDSLIERLTDYYLSRKDYAFAPVPKAMELMEGQYFSQVFRREEPSFNGLIWAYHWLQVGLYEPFIEGKTKAEKKAGVDATVARFWSMLEDPPNRFPKMMPMTSAIAPKFSAQHPRAAAIFDNLHMMHDIISDILASEKVPRSEKRAVIYAQLAKLQDTTREVMSWDEWRNMAEMMGGVDVMGGPATGLLAAIHAPVTPSPAMAVIKHDTSSMGAEAPDSGMAHGGMAGMADSAGGHAGMPGMEQGARHKRPGMQHDSTGPARGAPDDHMRLMMELHRRMMADPVIRQRIMADSTMRRMMMEMMDSMPPAH